MEGLAFSICWLAFLVAVIIRMLIGWLWYGPLFGKTWMGLVGFQEGEIEGQGKAMGLALVVAIVMAFVLSVLMDYVGANNLVGGLFTGFFIWLGFVATTQYQLVLFENRETKLFLINTGYEFTSILCMSILLAIWQ